MGHEAFRQYVLRDLGSVTFYLCRTIQPATHPSFSSKSYDYFSQSYSLPLTRSISTVLLTLMHECIYRRTLVY